VTETLPDPPVEIPSDPEPEIPSEPEPESEDDDEPDLTEAFHFNERVERVYSLIHEDESKRDRCLAEIYVFMCTMDQAVRKMMGMGGPIQMLTKMMGGKSETNA